MMKNHHPLLGAFKRFGISKVRNMFTLDREAVSWKWQSQSIPFQIGRAKLILNMLIFPRIIKILFWRKMNDYRTSASGKMEYMHFPYSYPKVAGHYIWHKYTKSLKREKRRDWLGTSGQDPREDAVGNQLGFFLPFVSQMWSWRSHQPRHANRTERV